MMKTIPKSKKKTKNKRKKRMSEVVCAKKFVLKGKARKTNSKWKKSKPKSKTQTKTTSK